MVIIITKKDIYCYNGSCYLLPVNRVKAGIVIPVSSFVLIRQLILNTYFYGCMLF